MSGDGARGRPGAMWMVAACVAIAGVVTAPKVRVLPEAETAASWIEALLVVPGHSADAVDRLVAGQMEDLLRSVPGIRSTIAISRRGTLTLRAGCAEGAHLASIRSAVAERLHRFCAKEEGTVRVRRISIGVRGGYDDGQFVRIGLWRDSRECPPSVEIRQTIIPALLRIGSVASVVVEGEEQRGVVITPHEGPPSEGRLDAVAIAAAVRAAPGAERIREIPVPLPDGGRVRPLSRVATIEERGIQPEVLWRIDGSDALILSVKRRAETDMRRLFDEIRTVLERCARESGGGLRWTILDDPSLHVRSDMLRTFWLGAVSLLGAALAGGWWLRSWRVAGLALAGPLCGLSGCVLLLAATGQILAPATASGMTVGTVGLLMWVIGGLPSTTTPGPASGITIPAGGGIAGCALMAFARFVGEDEPAAVLHGTGFAMAAVFFSGLSAQPLMAMWNHSRGSRQLPAFFRRRLRSFVEWCGSRKKITAAVALLLLGIPLWTIPRELPRSHPLFRLYYLTFGSPVYREFRPVIDQMLGGLVYLAITRSLRGEGEVTGGFPVVQVDIDMPAGSSQDAACHAAGLFEQEARVMVGVQASVVTMAQAGLASVRVLFCSETEHGVLPHRVCEALRGIASGVGNARIQVVGSGPGFQSGEGSLPTITIEARAYDRRILDLMATGFGGIVAADPRVHEVDLWGFRRTGEEENEVRLRIGPDAAGSITASEIARMLRDNSPQRLHVGPELVPVIVAGTVGDTQLIVGRGPGGAARGLKHLLKGVGTGAPSAIVREGREYVRQIGCLFDGPPEVARDVIADYCREYPVPPGCSLTVQGATDESGSASMTAYAGGLMVALLAGLLVLAVLRNSIRIIVSGLAAAAGALTGIASAASLFPIPWGDWSFCASGAAVFVSVVAGISAAEVTRPDMLFAWWIMYIGGGLAGALFPLLLEGGFVYHAREALLWTGAGIAAGLPAAAFAALVWRPTPWNPTGPSGGK